jgi:signal transduction histidine kinase
MPLKSLFDNLSMWPRRGAVATTTWGDLEGSTDRSKRVDQRGATIARSGRREVDLFRLAGTRSQRELIGGLGARAAIALGTIFILLVVIPGGHDAHPWLDVAAGTFAISVGTILLRLRVAAPLPLLDSLLVVADALLVLVGRYPSSVQLALPGIYVMIGTILFSVRAWRVVVAHVTLLSASYAGVLVLGPHQFAPVTRWLCVMVALATSGLFIRWLVATVAGLAFAEHSARDLAEAATWELKRESKSKSEFLARMSHELRTPLNVVLGFSDLLGEQLVGPLNPRQAEYAEDISSSARHLVALVGDVLDVATIESGDVQLDLRPLNVRRVLDDGLTMVRQRAAASSISLVLDVARHLDVVDADELKIRQVVVNLLANAVKFTPHGGRITVSARMADGNVRISVQDTGVGIAEEDRDRIFEEFAQSAPAAEGTGLGLPLARQFVELHGGRLWVDSAPDHGSTFSFDLPGRKPADSRAHATTDDRPEGPDYSAFTEPGSYANRDLLARIGLWVVLDASLLIAVIGAITPLPLATRIVMMAIGGTIAATTQIVRRVHQGAMRRMEVTTYIGLVAVPVMCYYSGPFSDLVPLTYSWSMMVSFALWPRRRALSHLGGVAVSYAIGLIVLAPSDPFGHWFAIMITVGFNSEVVSWVTDQLRTLVVAEQAAHRSAENVRAELAATSRHKGGFVANMSHELRAPLNAIIGFADLLQTEAVGPLNAQQHEYLTDVQTAARHLLAIINDVLDVAKLEAGQMKLTQDVVAVEPLLERAVSLSNPPEAPRRVRVALEIGSGIEFIVADHQRLEQVLVNLISNAIKFTPDGGRVHVAAHSSASGELNISVSDTGVGIAPSQRKQIFAPFHQGAPGPGDSLQAGTGLGLALVKGLVELHGGAVTVTSRPGHGSTFTVALPQLLIPARDFDSALEAQQ